MSNNYKIAMINSLHMGGYWRHWNMTDMGLEWLVVKRWGKKGQHLTCSDAGQLPGTIRENLFDSKNEVQSTAPGRAPDDSSPSLTFYAALLEEDKANNRATFEMKRKLPKGVTVEGSFFAATGLLQMVEKNGRMFLLSVGQHAHPVTNSSIDLLNPEEGQGRSWSHEAVAVNWVGQEGLAIS